ncbi:MAG: carbohydrate binding domain-containing protein [Oscillospiraceae bacterium]|nr:carbohydrate binding domain-containing protein [Oscillospiraceae bacterium]
MQVLICAAAVLGCTACANTETGKTDHTQQTETEQTSAEQKNETAQSASNEAEAAVQNDRSRIYGTEGEVSAYDTENSHYSLTIDAGTPVHDISDTLFGIFIEDINFAADGGLYAEMVQNRSFEFTDLASGNERHAWSDVGVINANVVTGDGIADGDYQPLNENNPNYMTLENTSGERAGIANKGFLDGMAIKENAAYDVSAYIRGVDGYSGRVYFALTADGEMIAEEAVTSVSDEWHKYEVTLTPSVKANKNVKLQVLIDDGKADIDFISMLPQDTYKGRKNGLRKDLAEKLEALEPKFLRFPGGCVTEGYTLDLAYDWKDSVGVGRDGEPLLFNDTYGDVAARKQGQNIWTDERTNNDPYPSYMSYGLGFYEYFLLAEDLNALPVPVLNVGMHCIPQGHGREPDINSDEFRGYIQDALDLVEFCKGDPSTKWGAVRAAMGHPEPFELKYVGIGNEDWGDIFFEKYTAFAEAFAKAKRDDPEMYGDIELIYTAGPDDGDSGHTMYMDSYDYAEYVLSDGGFEDITDFAGLTDHHYYNSPEWFLEHTDYYDESNYSRSTDGMTASLYGGGIPVFLGEYAAQSNTMKAALAEAAYMTGLERNGDIVKLAAYAPLFGNLTALHWSPDLIWFSNDTVTCSVNYYVQQIFARNAGTRLLSSELNGARITEKPRFAGKIGVGTWNTKAFFDNIKIVDNDTGEVIAEDDFSSDSIADWQKASDGNWAIKDGALEQSAGITNTDLYSATGSAVYFGEEDRTNYTYTLEAAKISGMEGFLIPFSVGDKENNWFWNIGGWNNTVSCLQKVKDGIKSDQVSGTVTNCRIRDGKTYALKIVVTESNVKCYMDDRLMIDYDIPETSESEAYEVTSTDETGDIIIKLINEKNSPKTFAIDIQNAGTISESADVEIVSADSMTADNILGQPESVTLRTEISEGITEKFNYTVSPLSVTVLRIHRQ